MTAQLLKNVGLALGACVVAAGCDSGPTGPAVQPPPPPLPQSAVDGLAGSYSLTVNLSDQCAALPDALRRRTYQATLRASTRAYLGISIVGGGFSTPVGPGDLWPGSDGRVAINWNNFDIGGCDGYPEPLSDGRTLMVCGSGEGVVSGPTIALTLNAEVFIDEAGQRQRVCAGGHEFTFNRSTASTH